METKHIMTWGHPVLYSCYLSNLKSTLVCLRSCHSSNFNVAVVNVDDIQNYLSWFSSSLLPPGVTIVVRLYVCKTV